jgi:hypothetical protein
MNERSDRSVTDMQASAPDQASTAPQAGTRASKVARLVRRVHMFTGLFLGPWMLMYALSTLVMTHRDYLGTFYHSKTPALVTERELDYTRSFPATVTREEIARQIVQDLGLEGRHYVGGGRDGKPLVITRQHALNLHRLTFDPAARKIIIEREDFRATTFLERMHRRRGYDQPYALEDTWALSVDVAVVTMVFWGLSGIWLWWELKATRLWGAVALVAGPALFVVFLALL